MKSFQTFLTEADSERDAKIRREVLKFWRQFLKGFKKKDYDAAVREHEKDPNSDTPWYLYGIIFNKAKSAVYLDMSQLAKEPKKLDRVMIAFNSDLSVGGSFSKRRSTHPNDWVSIQIFQGDSDFLKNYKNYSYILKKLKQQKNTFTHEMIHWSDSNRVDDWIGLAKSGVYYHKGDIQKYYNEPFEMNAFVQTVFSMMDQQWNHHRKKILAGLRKNPRLKDLIEFKETADNFFSYKGRKYPRGKVTSYYVNHSISALWRATERDSRLKSKVTTENKKRIDKRYYEYAVGHLIPMHEKIDKEISDGLAKECQRLIQMGIQRLKTEVSQMIEYTKENRNLDIVQRHLTYWKDDSWTFSIWFQEMLDPKLGLALMNLPEKIKDHMKTELNYIRKDWWKEWSKLEMPEELKIQGYPGEAPKWN